MSDDRSRNRDASSGERAERALDGAIASYPVRALPEAFVESTMRLVREAPRVAAARGASVSAGTAAAEAVIDDAIESYPLEGLPAGIVERTMSEVRAAPRATAAAAGPAPVSAPRFVDALQFMDLAVPAFVAVFMLATVGLAYIAWSATDPLTIAALELELRRATLAAPFSWLDAVRATLLTTTAGVLVVAATAAVLWIDRRRLILRRTMEARRA